MKNIIVGGTVRAGKSTLANLIRKKLNYSLCESDTIVNAFHKVFPELGIVHNKPEMARENYKEFLFEILDGFCKSLKYHGNVTIFPGSQFLPRHINEYSKKDRYIVIFLGVNDVTAPMLLNKLRETEQEHDWTHKHDNESLLKLCSKIIDESKEFEEECKKYGFYYFNTFYDREETLKNIVRLIEKEQTQNQN